MPQNAPLAVEETPMVSMVGRGPGSLRPRYRLSGLWF
jgi:heat shock protein HtpX